MYNYPPGKVHVLYVVQHVHLSYLICDNCARATVADCRLTLYLPCTIGVDIYIYIEHDNVLFYENDMQQIPCISS